MAHLVKVLELYLSMDADPLVEFKLDWLGRPGHFQVAFGGDGAPLGTADGAVSCLISVLNAGRRVLSREHNFLTCLAGTAKENHPDLVDYYRKVRVWIAELERDGVIINGTTYKVSFELLPVDQKFLTILAGELSNSSTYPTTFGDIHKDKLGTLSPVSQPWLYGKRLTDAAKVSKFKEKNKVRTKITQFISSLRSPQEFEPPLGEVVDRALIDPLHIKNNTWEKVNELILTEAILNLCAKKTAKLEDLPETDPVSVYSRCLKSGVKAGKVHRKFSKWYDVDRMTPGDAKFSCRFTGEDSTKLAGKYRLIIEGLLALEVTNASKLRLHVIGFIATQLATITVLMCKFNITEDDIATAREAGRLYHKAHVLFFTAGLLQWTLAYVVPEHMGKSLERFGKGLGINSTQGREAKHISIKSYKGKTTPSSMYTKIISHEYLDCVYLPSQDHSLDKYHTFTRSIIDLPHQDNHHLCGGSTPMCQCDWMYQQILKCCDMGKLIPSFQKM